MRLNQINFKDGNQDEDDEDDEYDNDLDRE